MEPLESELEDVLFLLHMKWSMLFVFIPQVHYGRDFVLEIETCCGSLYTVCKCKALGDCKLSYGCMCEDKGWRQQIIRP